MSVGGRQAPPSDLIELGAVRGAYGLKGWIRIAPHTAEADVLRATRKWWLAQDGRVHLVEVTGVRRHSGQLLAKWTGCESPEDAERLKGATVAVARQDFPPAPRGTIYWADVIGARVVNRTGEDLGTVRAMRNNGAQDLLEVARQGAGGEEVRLVPIVDAYVDRIDVEGRTITVDWQLDW
jgi:16S rRNA processing protein RimM